MFLPSNITLKFGDSGDFVAELQRRLAMVKCFTEDQVNGFYDGNTVNAVMQFQGMSGLHADGVAGPETLRRLNGVIAGDTSGGGTDDKKEEEAQRQMTETNALNLALAEQQAQSPGIWGEPAPREEAPATPAPAPETIGLDPAMFAAPAAAALTATAQPGLSEAMRADIARQENISQNPARELTDMVMNAAAQQQQQQTLQTAPPAAPQVPPPETLQPLAQQPAPMQPAPMQQPVEQTVQPQQEPQGLMQRAGRFANAMMQKLSDYFEAKLPPSVMAEVKAAGQVMAQSGVREAPIPTGPEMGGPAQQLPTRGPEQQPAQAR